MRAGSWKTTLVWMVLLRVCHVLTLAAALSGEEARYTVAGQVLPEAAAAVTLHAVASPFTTSTVADSRGRFQFSRVAAGAYTLAVFVPRVGEVRRTIEVGPGTAGADGRMTVTVDFREGKPVRDDSRHVVSTRELRVPDKARKEYTQAQKNLARNDVAGAIRDLERAVAIAPQFAEAWNNLGTIAYQTQKFELAEKHFRKALEQDNSAFEPLVNLGGVLLTLGRIDEALKYNLYAMLSRPEDALANSQLGMSYFAAGNLDLARKYLEIARRIDPAHFSHPQLVLAEVHLRRGDRAAAAAELEDFLKHHPDWRDAARIRQAIAEWRR